jgi:hypothetical protein
LTEEPDELLCCPDGEPLTVLVIVTVGAGVTVAAGGRLVTV